MFTHHDTVILIYSNEMRIKHLEDLNVVYSKKIKNLKNTNDIHTYTTLIEDNNFLINELFELNKKIMLLQSNPLFIKL